MQAALSQRWVHTKQAKLGSVIERQALNIVCTWLLSFCTSCRHLQPMCTGYGVTVGVMVGEEPLQQKAGDGVPNLVLGGGEGRDSCIYSQ